MKNKKSQYYLLEYEYKEPVKLLFLLNDKEYQKLNQLLRSQKIPIEDYIPSQIKPLELEVTELLGEYETKLKDINKDTVRKISVKPKHEVIQEHDTNNFIQTKLDLWCNC